MNPENPNLAIVELVAYELGQLCEDMVLVGGCAVGLLITDPARPAVRATIDVDLVVEVASLVNYYELEEKLRQRGFKGGDIICRWRKGELIVDVMPTMEIGLGFSNKWYPLAVRHATRLELKTGAIGLVSAPLFLATKIESFNGRGGGNYEHHDIEDVVNLIDGRPEIVDEVSQGDGEVREYLMAEFDDLLADPTFSDKLTWHLGPSQFDQARTSIVIERMRKVAGL